MWTTLYEYIIQIVLYCFHECDQRARILAKLPGVSICIKTADRIDLWIAYVLDQKLGQTDPFIPDVIDSTRTGNQCIEPFFNLSNDNHIRIKAS